MDNKGMDCDHEIAFVYAGKSNHMFPWRYRYMNFCWKCGYIEWVATERPT